MTRSLCFLAALLLACTLWAAPAPPKPFVSGWGKPADPDRDCTIRRAQGTLSFELPGGDHDYNPLRRQLNAPRLFREREIEGDFVMQVRVRIDYRPSVQSMVDGQPSSISAGFLVMLPQNHPLICTRVEFREARKGTEVHGYFDVRRWFDVRRLGREAERRAGGSIIEGARGREDEWKGDAYLRLDRQDGNLGFAISSDGENWKRSGAIGGIREKLKVGLAAYSTSTDPSKVRFDQLKVTQGKKKSK